MHSLISTLALSLGLATGGLAVGSYSLDQVLFTPEQVTTTASDYIEGKADSKSIVDQLDKVMGIGVDAGVAASNDPKFAASVAEKRAKVRAAAESALNDPQLRLAIKNAFDSLKAKFENGTLTPGTQPATAEVNGVVVSKAVKDSLAKTDPTLAAKVPTNLSKAVTISAVPAKATKAEPSGVQKFFSGIALKAALVSLAAILFALMVAPNKGAALRRIARWMFIVGAMGLGSLLVLPEFVLPQLGSLGATTSAFMGGGSSSLVGPSSALLAGGAMLLMATFGRGRSPMYAMANKH